MSRTTAKAIMFCIEKRFINDESAVDTANLIILVNDWFDIINS